MKYLTSMIIIISLFNIINGEDQINLPYSIERKIKKYEKINHRIEEDYKNDKISNLEKYNKELTDEFFDLADRKSNEDEWQNKINNYIKARELGVELTLTDDEKLAIKLLDIINKNESEMAAISDINLGKEKVDIKTISGGKEVVVDAAWKTEIKNVTKGQKIFIQYVEGMWRSPSESELENPNTTEKEHLKLTIYGKVNNNWQKLKVVDSAESAFLFEFKNDYSMIALAPQIRVGPVPNWNIMHKNIGLITYKVGIK